MKKHLSLTEGIAIAVLGILLVAGNRAVAQTTITNCQTMPLGSMIRTHCTSNTYDPWPAIRENRRIWEQFSKDMDGVAMKVQEQLLLRRIQKLEEQIVQKQKNSTIPTSEDLSAVAPKLTLLVQAQCKEGYLGEMSFSGVNPNASNSDFAGWVNGCRKLGYWKASAEELAQARQKAEYFRGLCQLSFQHAEFEKLPADSKTTGNFWNTFPTALLLKEEVCQPWGFWNAGK